MAATEKSRFEFTHEGTEDSIGISIPQYDGAYEDAKERAAAHFDVDESELTEVEN